MITMITTTTTTTTIIITTNIIINIIMIIIIIIIMIVIDQLRDPLDASVSRLDTSFVHSHSDSSVSDRSLPGLFLLLYTVHDKPFSLQLK